MHDRVYLFSIDPQEAALEELYAPAEEENGEDGEKDLEETEGAAEDVMEDTGEETLESGVEQS